MPAFAFFVKVQPNAKKTEILGLETINHPASNIPTSMLKIRLAAPPIDGKANQVLCAFIAKQFDVPLRQVTLQSGEASKIKRILVDQPKVIPALLNDID
ncbi:DUF167 domain-containing protein [Aquirhabdus parva]|uniref:DUF167 domain-containing protein n=1 Tax=Aquirhabdus parva TaxID=2283318 RepID=UPI001AE28B6C|nr:DUF167 domain-containing protein [Aquirhabdus parva]